VVSILLVEDDAAIQKTVRQLLSAYGYEVRSATTGAEAIERLHQRPSNLVVLDLWLPDMDGLDVCRRIRSRSDAPIVVLSARAGDHDKLAAFNAGADDYVCKPFNPDELLARIRVVVRRHGGATAPIGGVLHRGGLTIDFDRRRVMSAQKEVQLTPKEFDLLAFLAQYPNRVLTRSAIASNIWGDETAVNPEQLWTLVNKLRRKLELNPTRPRVILTVPWVGYQFVVDQEAKVGDAND
jgi:two-component system, OmpR family, KDP operon response regulator KdpE